MSESKITSDRTRLPRSGLEISRVGLGFAHAHTFPQADREWLIQRALELGITHFDTARFYSDGLSEETLGRALAGKRQSVTIATKFGLVPTPFIASAGPAAPVLRKGRSLLNKLKLVEYPQRSYTRATLRKSLEASLRALRTDYIDIYCLHEPKADSKPEEGLFEDLLKEKQRGTIRWVGISGAEIDPLVATYGSSLDFIQSAEASWSESRFVPDVSHSLFSGTVAAGGSSEDGGTIRQLLEQALQRRPAGGVVVQSRSTHHLEKIVEWAAGK